MLLNGKIEELKKYSKCTYDKSAFVEEVKNHWDLTDLQIRMTYLISDLAVKAEGVFSIAYNTFIDMFEQRFNMKVSLSSVRRFFGLLSKIGVLSVNAAKRKNNKQSANIYIIEPINNEIGENEISEKRQGHPEEQVYEHPEEQHNITFKDTLNTPLNKNNFNCNYKKPLPPQKFKILLTDSCNEFYTKFSVGRYSKKQWNTLIGKFVNDTVESKRYINVPEHKIKGFAYKCLEKICDNSDYKHSEEFAEYQEVMNELANKKETIGFQDITLNGVKLFNWLEKDSNKTQY
ncbi:hypothetical protein [Priestia endophytica]|uniref:hypothetical protein n=1 Tax=Priestia endophytica TaxID=135735 RepID=UPI00124C7A8F|nr:hypothetical protein [Priestia endophytica]KAB2489989.1 hypothetical protein F8155_21600 [Priestia endophytica]